MLFETARHVFKVIDAASDQYAWWRDPRWGISIWVVGCLLLIGIVWPSVINLMTFGSLLRLQEEPATDLSKVEQMFFMTNLRGT